MTLTTPVATADKPTAFDHAGREARAWEMANLKETVR
jgi:hypothetical protein